MAWNKLSTYKTRVTQDDAGIVVRYHDTDIVKTYPEMGRRVVELNTGGVCGTWGHTLQHGSVTTKRKMNQASNQFALGYSVHQHNHRWYVTTKAGKYEYDGNVFVFDADTGLPWGIVAIFAGPNEETV